MRKLNLGIKTGFRVTDPTKPIIIRDNRGVIFYQTESMVPKVEYFNMPAGNYFVEKGWFSETLLPRVYPLSMLPPPERSYPDPTDFAIEFDNNPNKCSILWDEKTIVFDNVFRERPYPEVFFILYHEYGHQLYSTEKYADLFATNLMKLKGFNPSQIRRSQNDSLSDNQVERKEFITEKLNETLN